MSHPVVYPPTVYSPEQDWANLGYPTISQTPSPAAPTQLDQAGPTAVQGEEYDPYAPAIQSTWQVGEHAHSNLAHAQAEYELWSGATAAHNAQQDHSGSNTTSNQTPFQQQFSQTRLDQSQASTASDPALAPQLISSLAD